MFQRENIQDVMQGSKRPIFTKRVVVFFIVFCIIALVSIVLVWDHYYGGKIKLIVVNKDLPIAHIITKDDIDFAYFAPDVIPDAALTQEKEAVGQVMLFPVSKGEVITHKYLDARINPETLAALIPQGLFGLMLTNDLFLASLPKIEAHDVVSIIGNTTFGRDAEGNVLGYEVYFVVYDAKGNPQSFLLALTAKEIEAFNLAQFSRASLILVVNPHD